MTDVYRNLDRLGFWCYARGGVGGALFRAWAVCILVLSLVSCGGEAVREYFEYYTSTAAIDECVNASDFPRDADGRLCVPYTPSAKLQFRLRNPYGYKVLPNIHFLSAKIDPTLCTLVQDSKSVLTVMIKDMDALKKYERGGDISFRVELNEAETRRPFPSYTFALSCNTPPYVSGAAVCSDGTHYVLCFNLPPKADMASGGVQSDITSISAGGKSTSVAIAADGSFTIEAASGFVTSAPAGLTQVPGGAAFTPSSQCVYLVTGDSANSGNKEYAITVTDSKGLTGKKSVLSVPPKLGAVRLLSGGTAVSNGAVVSLPQSISAADFVIDPSADALNSGAGVHYEVYSMPSGALSYSGNTPSGAADVSLKAGIWKVVAWAVKDLYADGAPLTVMFTVNTTAVANGTVVLDLPQNYKMTINAPASVARGSSIAVSVSVKDASGAAAGIASTNLTLENRGTIVPNGTASGSGSSASVATDAAWPAEAYRLIVVVTLDNGYQFSQTLGITLM